AESYGLFALPTGDALRRVVRVFVREPKGYYARRAASKKQKVDPQGVITSIGSECEARIVFSPQQQTLLEEVAALGQQIERFYN
ncbi:unnamed protein product, partial [Amoebophrya sp. A25]